jgi:hypothetical protein
MKIYYTLYIAPYHFITLWLKSIYIKVILTCHVIDTYEHVLLHVDMLILFKRLLTKEQMSMQKVRMENFLLHLTCENNHDGIVSILCTILNLLFILFFVTWIINCISLCDVLQLCENYVKIIFTKGKREKMWKRTMNLVMIQWTCVSNTKQEWRLTIKSRY